MNSTAYLVLKTAQNLYGKAPAALAPEELAQARGLADRQATLERRVLASSEARDAVVPGATLEAAVREIRGRYPDEEAFLADLAANGLDPEGFSHALERELKVDAVLEKVGSRAALVSPIDVELYYHYHPDQFQRPETRQARHILITINEDLAENTREAAMRRASAIAARLAKDPRRFEEQAMKHSECPTALQGGLLGEVRRGQLYAELEAVLFELEPGRISALVESPLGLHILRCEAVSPAGPLPLDSVRDKIRQHLEARRKRICQKAWLKTLGQT